MVFENGTEWKPSEPGRRGRHASFKSAVDAALAALSAESDPFFDSIADAWPRLFPGLPARPGRWADGKVVLYVASAPILFSVRPKLRAVKKALSALPGAPKRLDVILEIRR